MYHTNVKPEVHGRGQRDAGFTPGTKIGLQAGGLVIFKTPDRSCLLDRIGIVQPKHITTFFSALVLQISYFRVKKFL
jgi:hypothetical protein